MPRIDEIASWYQDDDQFDPKRSSDPLGDESVRMSEDAAKAQGQDLTFADALIAVETRILNPEADTDCSDR